MRWNIDPVTSRLCPCLTHLRRVHAHSCPSTHTLQLAFTYTALWTLLHSQSSFIWLCAPSPASGTKPSSWLTGNQTCPSSGKYAPLNARPQPVCCLEPHARVAQGSAFHVTSLLSSVAEDDHSFPQNYSFPQGGSPLSWRIFSSGIWILIESNVSVISFRAKATEVVFFLKHCSSCFGWSAISSLGRFPSVLAPSVDCSHTVWRAAYKGSYFRKQRVTVEKMKRHHVYIGLFNISWFWDFLNNSQLDIYALWTLINVFRTDIYSVQCI